MNKRQSKKHELQAQVDDLQAKVERFRRNMNLNATIANNNQERVDNNLKNIIDNVEKLINIQKDAGQDVQRQFKYVNLNSIIHSVAISALATAIVFISIRVML